MTQSQANLITVRQPVFEFPAPIDRYWMGGSVFKTHLLNTFTLMLPEMERYLIQVVNQGLKQAKTPECQEQGRSFIGQEAQHAKQHIRLWEALRQQGYQIDSYLESVRFFFFKVLMLRCSTPVNLAIGAAGEHLTTLVAAIVLEENFLADAEPSLKDLFEWHAAEEIEHRSVVYNVLHSVTDRYPIRILGLLLSHGLVLGLLFFGLLMLLYQDKKLLDRQVWREMMQFWFTKEKVFFKLIRNAVQYTQPNFHPSQQHQFLDESAILQRLA